MKRSVIALVSIVAIAGSASVAGAETKIGVVNTQRLMDASPQAKSANQALNAEFAPREQEIKTLGATLQAAEDKLNKDAPTMTEVQRTAEERRLRDSYRQYQQKQEELQDDFNARRSEQLRRVQTALISEVQAYAKAQGFDLILADGVLFATAALDVTDPVLAALENRAKAAAAAPAPAKPAATPAKP